MQQQADVTRVLFRVGRGLVREGAKASCRRAAARQGRHFQCVPSRQSLSSLPGSSLTGVAHQGAPKLRGMAPTALSPVTIWNTLAASAISELLT